MIDFLTNLAARSLNRLPVIQPRLASLFEPIRREREPAVGEHLNPDFSASGAVYDWFEPRVQTPASIGEHGSATREAPPMRPRAISDRARGHAADRAGEPAELSDELVAPPEFERSRQLTRARRRTRSEPPIEQAANELLAEINRGPNQAASPRQPATVADAHRQVTSTEHTHMAASQLRVPSLAPTVAKPDPTERPEVRAAVEAGHARPTPAATELSPRQPPRFATVAAPPTPRNVLAAEARPIVRVTIGRVEVRAIVTPAQTPTRDREKSRPPQLSLDEYLKRRNGESR